MVKCIDSLDLAKPEERAGWCQYVARRNVGAAKYVYSENLEIKPVYKFMEETVGWSLMSYNILKNNSFQILVTSGKLPTYLLFTLTANKISSISLFSLCHIWNQIYRFDLSITEFKDLAFPDEI